MDNFGHVEPSRSTASSLPRKTLVAVARVSLGCLMILTPSCLIAEEGAIPQADVEGNYGDSPSPSGLGRGPLRMDFAEFDTADFEDEQRIAAPALPRFPDHWEVRENDIQAIAHVQNYDRTRARQYIDAYAKKPTKKAATNPQYGRCKQRKTKDEADCTNFASQVLAYGGLPQQFQQHPEFGWWSSGWPFGCMDGGSSRSWRSVNHLLYYLVVESSSGSIVRSAPELEVGDVIFYDLDYDGCEDVRYDHTAIVSSHDESGAPRVSYHTNDQLDVDWDSPSFCDVVFVHITY